MIPVLTFANHPGEYSDLYAKVKYLGENNLEILESNQKIKGYNEYKIRYSGFLSEGDIFWIKGFAWQTDSTWTYQCQGSLFCSDEICKNEYREQNMEECIGPTELTVYPFYTINIFNIVRLAVIFSLFIYFLKQYRKNNPKIKKYYSLIFLIGILVLLKIFFNISISIILNIPEYYL